MEIQVKVVKILDAQRFVSKKDGSEIVKNTFVGETAGQYPRKIAFSVMGKDKFNQMCIVVGGTYTVSFDVESREWQGKWFTECSAWKAVRIDGQQANETKSQTQTPTPAPTSAPQDGGTKSDDDLPF